MRRSSQSAPIRAGQLQAAAMRGGKRRWEEELGRVNWRLDPGISGEERGEEGSAGQVSDDSASVVDRGPRHGAEELGQLMAWRQ